MAAQKDIKTVFINATADGDQTVLPLPGLEPAQQEAIVIVGYLLQPSGTGVCTVRTATSHIGFAVKDPGAAMSGQPGACEIRFPAGEAVEVNNPVGVDLTGWISYYVE